MRLSPKPTQSHDSEELERPVVFKFGADREVCEEEELMENTTEVFKGRT